MAPIEATCSTCTLAWKPLFSVVIFLFEKILQYHLNHNNHGFFCPVGLSLLTAGTTVENKGKLILTEIFPSVQKHDI